MILSCAFLLNVFGMSAMDLNDANQEPKDIALVRYRSEKKDRKEEYLRIRCNTLDTLTVGEVYSQVSQMLGAQGKLVWGIDVLDESSLWAKATFVGKGTKTVNLYQENAPIFIKTATLVPIISYVLGKQIKLQVPIDLSEKDTVTVGSVCERAVQQLDRYIENECDDVSGLMKTKRAFMRGGDLTFLVHGIDKESVWGNATLCGLPDKSLNLYEHTPTLVPNKW